MIFKNLFGKKKNEEKAGVALPLSPAVKDAVINTVGVRSIPPMPASAAKAFKLSTDPKAEARDFVDVIEADEALAARVVRIANSVYFDRGKKSSSVEEAVLVIGTNELKSLLSANSLTDIFPSKHPLRDFLWAHDVGCALVARSLAQRFLPSKSDTAFLAGLMHDIGKLLLLQRCTSEYSQALLTWGTSGREIRDIETQLFPFDHTEVGQLIAEKWQFADEVTHSIRHHHDTSPSDLALLVKAADAISHAAGLGYPGNFTTLQHRNRENLAEVLSLLNIPENEVESYRLSAIKNFEVEGDLYINRK